MSAVYLNLVYLIALCLIPQLIFAFPEIGKWEHTYYNVTSNLAPIFPKSLYSDSKIYIIVGCSGSKGEEREIQISWTLTDLMCWNNYILFNDIPDGNTSHKIEARVSNSQCKPSMPVSKIQIPKPETQETALNSRTSDERKEVKKRFAEDMKQQVVNNASGSSQKSQESNRPTAMKNEQGPVYIVTADGLYVLQVFISPQVIQPVNLTLEVKMYGPHGYLSAVDWPLLPFYGAMCVVYVIFGIVWLAVSFCQWRDLLRVQFWIGAVILLGMLEKATFYANYQSLNSTGKSVRAAVLLAELVSCAKRTLARMLVIIVSLGFGIVKPRLGPALHRVILTGSLYMILAAVESYLRVRQVKDDSAGRQLLLASVPLAVLDSAICWWIFSSLAQTSRTLRLRRNHVKLSLYRHFTNTLIFAVVSSLVFMLYSIRYHRLTSCLTDWTALWLDDAYWHLLFSLLLLVIMILWRPGNNNQRYAFSPLLDAPEDEDEDDDDEQFVSDAFGVKMRGMNRSNSPKPPKSTNTAEEDLKWVEENIPSSMPDTALPVLDSDEEIMTTKFEVSKMQ